MVRGERLRVGGHGSLKRGTDRRYLSGPGRGGRAGANGCGDVMHLNANDWEVGFVRVAKRFWSRRVGTACFRRTGRIG